MDGSGKALFTMTEEHQLGPGETISPGVSRKLFNGVCAGCHGSISHRRRGASTASNATLAGGAPPPPDPALPPVLGGARDLVTEPKEECEADQGTTE